MQILFFFIFSSLSALCLALSAANCLSLSWTALSNSAALTANTAVCCLDSIRSDYVLSSAALAAGSIFVGIRFAGSGMGTLGVGAGDPDEAAGTGPTGGGAGDTDEVAAETDPTGGGAGTGPTGGGGSLLSLALVAV